MTRNGWIRLGVMAIIVAVIATGIALRDELSRQALEGYIAALGHWAPLVFVAAYACAAVAFLPGSVFTIAGGALFGPWFGTLYSLLGASLGALVAFLAARYLAADWVARSSGERLERLRLGIDREGWRFVAFVRLVPLFPFNLLNYALGLTRIGLLPYGLATFVCMAPGALAYAWVGHAGAEVFAGGRSGIQAGLLALGLMAAVAFLPRLIRRVKNDPSNDTTTPE
ncbi:MAG: TVP38/TMEM64 family protein [Halofilum sp. (in: g-proteobacteria)]